MGACLNEKKESHNQNTSPATDLLIGPRTTHITKQYQYRNTLGQGSYGKVYRMKNVTSGNYRAVKQINKGKMSEQQLKQIKKQFQILKKMNHPNIVQVFQLYQTMQAMFIVTQLLQGGQLFDFIIKNKHFGQFKASILMKTLLEAINYCHKQNIVHRDIKPQNIIFSKPDDLTKIKLVDFGCSKNIQEHMNQLIGTPFYLAPQVIKKNYNEKCDIWSCGVILYILFTGSPPFYGDGLPNIKQSILTGQYDKRKLNQLRISGLGIDLVQKMLTYDYHKRPSAQECLNHVWFKNLKSLDSQIPKQHIQQSIKNMRNFFKQSKLSMVIQTYIFNSYNKQDTTKLQRVFKNMDKNNDGVLTRDQIQDAIKQNRLSNENTMLMKQLVESMSSKSPFINYTQFLVASSNKRNLLCQQRIDSTFKQIDSDGSGHIDVRQLKRVLIGAQISEIKELMSQVDGNSDGEISLQEWRKMLNNRVSQMR